MTWNLDLPVPSTFKLTQEEEHAERCRMIDEADGACRVCGAPEGGCSAECDAWHERHGRGDYTEDNR